MVVFAARRPPSNLSSIVPGLLRTEAANNCNECPDCEDLDPLRCYECSQKGNVTGGEITVSPSQPKPGDTVTFTVSPWQIDGRKEKCKSSCGPEGTECDVEEDDRNPHWVLEKKNGNGDWVEIASGSSLTVIRRETACAELRLRLPESVLLGATGNCDELKTTEKEKEVHFAEFTLKSVCVAEGLDKSRTTIGIGEEVEVEIIEAGAGSASWTIDGVPQPGSGTSITATAGPSAGSLTVEAEINGCKRRLTFSVIEPTRKNYIVIPSTVINNTGQRSVYFKMQMDLDPDTVSFYRVVVVEMGNAGCCGTGWYADNPIPPHNASGVINEVNFDNTLTKKDTVWGNIGNEVTAGTFEWHIPNVYAAIGAPAWKPFENKTLQAFDITETCVFVTKDGQGPVTGCRPQP